LVVDLACCCSTHTNAVLRDAALPAYDRFLVHGARALVSDKRVQNAQQVYTCFIRDALEVLNSQGADPMRVSLAIRTIGKLAAPIAKFSGKGSLKEAFHRLQPFGGSLRYKSLNKMKHDTLKHLNCKPERGESDGFLPCLRELRKSNGQNGGHL
jgi:hypothetical protein